MKLKIVTCSPSIPRLSCHPQWRKKSSSKMAIHSLWPRPWPILGPPFSQLLCCHIPNVRSSVDTVDILFPSTWTLPVADERECTGFYATQLSKLNKYSLWLNYEVFQFLSLIAQFPNIYYYLGTLWGFRSYKKGNVKIGKCQNPI